MVKHQIQINSEWLKTQSYSICEYKINYYQLGFKVLEHL
jgi:hypothetical protein